MSFADLLILNHKQNQENMNIIKLLLQEIENEFQTTKKFLSLVPADKFDWAPHERSMKMKSLASHIAELPEWITLAISTDELDFAAAPYQEKKIDHAEDLLKLLITSYESGKSALEKMDPATLEQQWVLRNGEQVLADLTKYGMIRMAISQTIHHRAQMGVYLRLLNIPIPGTYGPSADEQGF